MGRKDLPTSRSITRRKAIAGLGVSSLPLIAGCQGDGEGTPGTTPEDDTPEPGDTPTQEPEDEEWPPAVDRLTLGHTFSPGGTGQQLNQFIVDYLPNHIDSGDELNFQIQSLEGAGGLTILNYTANTAEPDGRFIAYANRSSMLQHPVLSPERTQYDPEDFNILGQARFFSRLLTINHRTTDVEDHWDWDWEDIKANLPELTLGSLGEGHGMTISYRLLGELHPDINVDDLDIVHYGGGSELRAAIQREEVDAYLGGFAANYTPREDFYKAQLVVTDESGGDYYDAVMDLTDDEATTMEDTDYQQDSLDTILALIPDAHILFAPPEMTDSVYDVWSEGLSGAFNDEAFQEDIGELTDLPSLYIAPEFGREYESVVMDQWETVQNNQDLIESVGSG